MKNYVKKITCLLLGVLAAASSVMVTACKDKPDSSSSDSSSSGKEQVHNTETRPVVFATDALDGNFNPFFATSATDSTIAAITQVGMLSSDKDGDLTYGKDEPTVVLDYKETMKDSNKQVTTNAAEAADGGTTEYEFIIKNGLKFSDGEPLTIKDVLFNLYVYLDPYYMGSATLYSTDIQGLKAYRAQDPDLQDGDKRDLDTKFYAKADQRINDLLEYLTPETGVAKPEKTAQIEKDIARVKELFVEEAQSDWTLAAGTQESYKEEYTFTEDWQIYYFREGIVKVQYNQTTNQALKDENGKYITSLDLYPELTENILAVKNGENHDKEEYTLTYWMNKEGCTQEEAAELAVQAYAIDQVIDANTSTDGALANVIRYWPTGSNARDDFAAEERSKYFKENGGKVESISGIQQSTTTKDFSGNDLGETHDVLKIVINGVDPKAKWNFAFSVAPMHYYSNEEAIATTKYGVKFSDKDFFDTVLQDPEKNGLPVGAGVYKATNESDSGNVNKNNFYRNNRVYFARNEYFYTMLGDGTDTSNNAKIKYMQYRVVSSNRIMQALEAGSIDFGAPQATKDNIEEIGKYDFLAYRRYRTNGYGYVGINPKFVPDIEVRRAIMKAMNTAMIVTDYYTSELADVIYRPMSLESWAYPNGIGEYANIAMTRDKREIQALVESAGYKMGGDGIYVKDGKSLEIVFTIAGESVDHPAYDMFQDAAKFLNTCGFKISVTTDITALKRLATGGLAVWAAAWSTTIDPDLYQIYHKDSKATSVKNWGYSTIYADTTGQFNYEKTIIDDLSVLIEEGRATLNQKEREEIYAEALDLIMELAVELPTYQRNDLVVYNRTVIDASTLNPTPTANAGVYDRLWEVNYL